MVCILDNLNQKFNYILLILVLEKTINLDCASFATSCATRTLKQEVQQLWRTANTVC